jgi:NAD+ kinase
MSSKSLTFALFGNLYQQEKSAAIQQVLACLKVHGARVLIDEEYYHFINEMCDVHSILKTSKRNFSVFAGDDFQADFAISMGGDGTFLKTAGRVGAKQIPILGINMGRLGFLADVTPDDVEACMQALHDDDYAVENRAVIQVKADGQPLCEAPYALNDVAILKRDTASMISVRASINGQYLNTYQADGLVISTPTGSTAYSLSNGGPIIVPGTKVFSMTAVAPHSLNVRPIVFSDSSIVELDVESRSHNFLVAIDGRSEKCKEGTKITLRRAPYDVKVVKRSDHRYFNTLREKMMWGADTR